MFFAGKTLFKGKNDEETLDNIRKVNYSFDIEKQHEKENINKQKEAKDLIEKILIKDPTKRIGYGSKYKEIKEHPFFKGINFDNLSEEPIPLNKIYSTLQSFGYIPITDASKEKDDDIYINVLNKSEYDALCDDKNSIGSADNAELSTSCKRLNNNINLLRNSLSNSIKVTEDNNMIIENLNKIETPKSKKYIDEVLIEDTLYKKSPWLHYNKRYVKLYSKGHLDYYDFSSKILKGSIIINEDTRAYAQDDYRFEIMNQNKIFYFKHLSKRIADNWVDNINNIIREKKLNQRNKNY